MSRTNIAAQSIASTYYPTLPLGAGSADIVETANDDPTDRDTALVDGKTLVLAHNTDSGAHTITFTSVVDAPFNRTGDISAYSIAAGKIAKFGPFKSAGWANSGRLQIDVSDPKIRLTVLQLP